MFSAVIAEEPENPEAWGGLVRALLALDQTDAARQALEQVPAKIADHAAVAGARSALALAEEGREAASGLTDLERRLTADPADHEARYELATALNATGQRDEAAAALLEIVRRERGWNGGCGPAAAAQVLRGLGPYGPGDPRGASQAIGDAVQLGMDGSHPGPGRLPTEIPVFPLAGALLLPHGKLPLHIFEPRYKAMVEDALAENRVFGMIQPDSQGDEDVPNLYRVGCVGRLSSFSETEDGRYLIALTGLIRFEVRRNWPSAAAIAESPPTSRVSCTTSNRRKRRCRSGRR